MGNHTSSGPQCSLYIHWHPVTGHTPASGKSSTTAPVASLTQFLVFVYATSSPFASDQILSLANKTSSE
ncbi:hypothetical protein CUMW_015690 [Citrus unshiu]|nr:hypothetical protein CUMW_015690 [Citrus unshiu]